MLREFTNLAFDNIICYIILNVDCVFFRDDRERWGTCEDPSPCADKDELFWAKDKRCYRKHARGPCTEGQLLVSSAMNDLIGDCRCENVPELATYFWAPAGQ